MRLHKRHAIPVVVLLAALAAGSYALAGGGSGKFDENLSGYQEDPLTLSTTGHGTFDANISKDGTEISYRLSYATSKAASPRRTSTWDRRRRAEASPRSCAPTWVTGRRAPSSVPQHLQPLPERSGRPT